MCIRDSGIPGPLGVVGVAVRASTLEDTLHFRWRLHDGPQGCLLYTSDAADERSSVDLGGRRILKKKK